MYYIPWNKRPPILHYTCFVIKNFIKCLEFQIHFPIYTMLYRIQRPISSVLNKEKKKVFFQFKIFKTYSSFLWISNSDGTSQWDEGTALSLYPIIYFSVV